MKVQPIQPIYKVKPESQKYCDVFGKIKKKNRIIKNQEELFKHLNRSGEYV